MNLMTRWMRDRAALMLVCLALSQPASLSFGGEGFNRISSAEREAFLRRPAFKRKAGIAEGEERTSPQSDIFPSSVEVPRALLNVPRLRHNGKGARFGR